MNKIVSLGLFLSFCWGELGCMDPMAYNCEDDQDSTTYIIDVGGTKWDNSCNWSWDLENSEYVLENNGNNCNFENVPDIEEIDCLGYYNPNATEDDGSCKYFQAPSSNDIIFTILSQDSIYIDWSLFQSPENATLESYHIQRCDDEFCQWIPGATPGNSLNQTNIIDVYDWNLDVEIKYAFFVRYSGYSWSDALDYTYLVPTEGCMDSNASNFDPYANVDDGSCNSLSMHSYNVNEFQLIGAFPNPFNSSVLIDFYLDRNTYINLNIIDLNGRVIQKIINNKLMSGFNQINWSASDIPSGIYFIHLESDQINFNQVKKIIYLK